ncbi:unnamed protein product [Didymodactylos carnosus]|nr:unnamed protein product [Didymodactylos carnosus]CAF3791106.1 unnamed protein product [Didymodactylos carnosus]
MSSEIIARYCDKIGQQSQDVSTEELKLLSDCIIQELNKLKQETNNDSFIGVIHEILARMTITDTIELVNIFAFDLELLTLFRDTLTSLFNKCNNNENLNEQETIVFKDIISIFLSMINRVNNTNVDILRTLILNEVLIKSIKLYIDNIDKHLNDPNLFAFDILIRGFETLMEKRKELQDDSTVLILLAAIVKCICSTCYIDIFKQFQLDKTELSMKEHFLLLTCPHYIVYGYDGKHIEEVQIELCHTMLNRYLEILEQFIPLIKQWSNDLIIQVMSYLTGILQYTSIRELQQKYLNVHLKLIDAIIVILNAPNLLDKLVEGTTDSMSCLIFTAITYLYGLIFHPTFATVIKEKQLTSTFVKLAEISNDEHIQIHTYRILAMIMNENDIKTLANPAKITEVFINFIKCLADNAVRKRVLQNTLISLKNLVQHDQIKDELVKQGAIPLLIQCATETKDDPINIQQYALEILWALTFNEQAPNILKNDQNFMTHIRSLQSCSERGVAKAAEGLIWKLEKEAEYIMTKKEQEEMIETELSRSFMRFRFKRVAKPTIKIEPTNDAHKYDVMISYSHSDKDVCYQIQERLVKDNFRVWLDRDNLYGSQ